jgi:phage terminase small subunit
MARQRNPKRDEAFEIWKQHNGEITNRALAEQLGVPEKTISGWKSKDKWNDKLNGVLQKKIRSTPNKKGAKKARAPNKKESVVEEVEASEITDQQSLFCMHYVKSFNATMAAIKAGYSKDTAHVQGSRLLRNVKVAEYIRELKAELQEDLFISAKDVMNYYVKIAFADITDYVTFQRKDVQTGRMDAVMSEDGKGVIDMVPRIESYNEMFFKNSDEIDGTIVSEVKQGRDGVSVKLIDKKWALDKLDRYFDLFPDAFKRRIEEEKLKIAQLAAKEDDADDYEDDGFLEAIDSKGVNWHDEET